LSALAERLALLQRQSGARAAPRVSVPCDGARGARAARVDALAAVGVSTTECASTESASIIAPEGGAEATARSVTNAALAMGLRAPLASERAAQRTATATSGSTIEHLRRLLGLRERRAPPPVSTDRDLPGIEVAPGLRLHQHRLDWLPLPVAALDLQAIGGSDAIDAARLKFFDTETTGLAGGTGTRAFMLGLGDWHDGAFRVRQLTLTAMGGEHAMLAAFARWFEPDDVLVSYNGRCYDAPLLATRYRLARSASPLPALAHLDLLHPTRRRYRGTWENCRLATIERHLLGVVREDDLPGSEAPRAWRDWLRGGSAADLRRVGDHNRQDLTSLARLLLHLAA
jgi:uncharacterized protein YprB with RNaseH-like and TPR domain